MTRSLPARPSLAQLKHQAKDLRIGARERDPAALSTLRQLRRFASASDSEIADATIALHEAQFALALDYGFPSFPALKQRVETLTSELDGTPGTVRTIDGATAIDGLESERWGGGTRRQNSVLATFSLIAERLGDETDYDFLMGVSGAAFRVQMASRQLCPSSPHARVGFDCATVAAEAWGRPIKSWPSADADETRRAVARAAVVASIDIGLPAVYDHEEASLIVGYTDTGLLLRRYSADSEGYLPMETWPFAVGIVSPKRKPRDLPELVRRSLGLAQQLFETEEVKGYRSGHAAYRRWCDFLSDETARASMTPEQRFSEAIGNAHSFESLADARATGANYLSEVAKELDPEVAGPLNEAARICNRIDAELRARRRALAPFPWEISSTDEWTPETRGVEVEFLKDIEALDASMIAKLGEAERVGARKEKQS